MSNSIRVVLALAVAAFVSACAQQEEVVYVDTPVTAEPTYTGKYK